MEMLLIAVGVLLILTGLFFLFRSLTSERASFRGGSIIVDLPLPIVLIVIGAGLCVSPLYFARDDGSNQVSERAGLSAPTTAPATTSAATTTSTTLRPVTTISPDPLPNIFAQIGDGKAFAFRNNRGVLQDDYVDDVGCHRDTRPFGLRLRWDMTGVGNPNGGWGVQWEDPSVDGFDASSFTSLAITVKGARGGERFQVGLKDLDGREVKIEAREKAVISKSAWRTLKVQLTEFTSVDTTRVANVNIGFNRNHGRGQICVDEISLT